MRRLSHVNWQQFEKSLLSIWGHALQTRREPSGNQVRIILPGDNQTASNSILVDRTNNRVGVEGPSSVLPTLHSVVETLDFPPAQDRGDVQLIGLGSAEPGMVRKAAALLGLQQDPSQNIQQAVRFAPFRKNAGVTLTGARTPAAQQQPENQQQPDQRPNILTVQDETIQGTVRIQVLEDIGAILLVGDPQDVERVKRVIESLQAGAAAARPDIMTYPLQNADSATLQPLLTDIYQNMYEVSSGAVSITALDQPNALVVVGQPQAQEIIAELIQKLDIQMPPDAALDFKVYRLKHMSAPDAALKIRSYFFATDGTNNDVIQSDTWIGSHNGPVVIIQDYRSNSLIVKGSPQNLNIVDKLIERLDVAYSDSVDEVRIFKIRNAVAAELAVVLQAAINGNLDGAPQGFAQTPGVGQQQQFQQQQQLQGALARVRSTMLQLMTIDREGKTVRSGILFDVIISADNNSNSLIVTAPPESMNLIAALIERLDQLPDAETQIKVFTIINGDASELLAMLQQLFGQAQGQAGAQAGQLSTSNLPLQSVSATEGSALINLRFGVDTRTNSIIASGAEGDLQVVYDLLLRLDEEDPGNRKNFVYRLSNAPAEDVATALNQWLEERRAINDLNPATLNPYETSRREVSVVPELVSNSLIVSATPEFYQEVQLIIQELDRRPPMIKIKVLLAEIQLDKLSEFGVEVGIQDSLLFDRGIGTVGFPFNQASLGNNNNALSLGTRELLAGQALSNLNIGRSNSDLGYGGLVLSAGNESINVLLRALEDKSVARVLSRPHITTVDNLQGRVQVGQQVPRITGASQNASGGITSDIEDVSVGVILEITPRVTPDGMIIMNVDAINSTLSSQGVPVFVSENQVVESNIIDIIQAQTTILARSGQTVVFSGLIQELQFNEKRGTPILSDLPVLGPLFSFESDGHTRNELLIVMTPYIIENDEQIAVANQVEMDRMNWCLSDVADIYGPIGYDEFDPEFLPSAAPATYFPDQDPLGENPQQMPPEQTHHQQSPAQPNLLDQSASAAVLIPDSVSNHAVATPIRNQQPPPQPADAGRNRATFDSAPLRQLPNRTQAPAAEPQVPYEAIDQTYHWTPHNAAPYVNASNNNPTSPSSATNVEASDPAATASQAPSAVVPPAEDSASTNPINKGVVRSQKQFNWDQLPYVDYRGGSQTPAPAQPQPEAKPDKKRTTIYNPFFR